MAKRGQPGPDHPVGQVGGDPAQQQHVSKRQRGTAVHQGNTDSDPDQSAPQQSAAPPHDGRVNGACLVTQPLHAWARPATAAAPASHAGHEAGRRAARPRRFLDDEEVAAAVRHGRGAAAVVPSAPHHSYSHLRQQHGVRQDQGPCGQADPGEGGGTACGHSEDGVAYHHGADGRGARAVVLHTTAPPDPHTEQQADHPGRPRAKGKRVGGARQRRPATAAAQQQQGGVAPAGLQQRRGDDDMATRPGALTALAALASYAHTVSSAAAAPAAADGPPTACTSQASRGGVGCSAPSPALGGVAHHVDPEVPDIKHKCDLEQVPSRVKVVRGPVMPGAGCQLAHLQAHVPPPLTLAGTAALGASMGPCRQGSQGTQGQGQGQASQGRGLPLPLGRAAGGQAQCSLVTSHEGELGGSGAYEGGAGRQDEEVGVDQAAVATRSRGRRVAAPAGAASEGTMQRRSYVLHTEEAGEGEGETGSDELHEAYEEGVVHARYWGGGEVLGGGDGWGREGTGVSGRGQGGTGGQLGCWEGLGGTGRYWGAIGGAEGC